MSFVDKAASEEQQKDTKRPIAVGKTKKILENTQ